MLFSASTRSRGPLGINHLGAQLVQHALAEARESGKRIVPVCPYVAKFLKGHDEFTDITDPVTADALRWLEAELG